MEYSAADLKFVPIEKPSNVKVPEGFDKVSMDLGHGALTTYQSFALDKIVLIYGVTPTGTEGFYYFDTVEKTFIRYIPMKNLEEETSTAPDEIEGDLTKQKPAEEDEGIFTRDNLSKMLIGAVALFLLMAIFAMVLMIQNARLGNKLEAAEERIRSLRRKKPGMKEEEEEEKRGKRARRIDPERDNDDEDEDDDDEDSTESGEPEGKRSLMRSNPDDRPVTGETVEIILEEAEDNNSSVKVPPVKETRRNKVEDAMKERPYGIDSAFDVVEGADIPEDKAKDAVDRDASLHVKSKEPQKVALPGDDVEDEG